MSFLELVKKRKSVRKYTEQPIRKEDINRCLEAARLAPSACNSQPWHYIIITDKALLAEVSAETYGSIMKFNKFTEKATALVVIVQQKPNLSSQVGLSLKKREYPLIDIGITATHFCLQAAELNIGTCMLGWYNESKIKALLNIPKRRKISLMISMGYPQKESDESRDKPRLDLEDMSSYEKYHK